MSGWRAAAGNQPALLRAARAALPGVCLLPDPGRAALAWAGGGGWWRLWVCLTHAALLFFSTEPTWRSWKPHRTLGSGFSGNTEGGGGAALGTCAQGQPLRVVPWVPPLQVQVVPSLLQLACGALGCGRVGPCWPSAPWRWSPPQEPGLRVPTWALFFSSRGSSRSFAGSQHKSATGSPVGRVLLNSRFCSCFHFRGQRPSSPRAARVPSPLAEGCHLCARVLLCLWDAWSPLTFTLCSCARSWWQLGGGDRGCPSVGPWAEKACAPVCPHCGQILINPLVRGEIRVSFHNALQLVQLKMIKVSNLCQQ